MGSSVNVGGAVQTDSLNKLKFYLQNDLSYYLNISKIQSFYIPFYEFLLTLLLQN